MDVFLNRNGTGKGDNDIATIGELSVNDVMIVTLEDDFDSVKVYGKSRIPAGIYEIKLRLEGTTHEKYKVRFKDIHKGMLHITGVPGYQYILIHCGNTVEDTKGCILTGSKSFADKVTGSEAAYRKIYPLIANPLSEGIKCHINIID